MRILMLTQFYPPIVGGQERHVHTLSVSLAARGHQVDVMTMAPTPGDVGIAFEREVAVHRVRSAAQRLPKLYSDASRPHAMPISDPKLRREIARLLTLNTYDIVHAHDWIVNSALRPAKHARVPVILTQHDYSHICATKRLMRNEQVCTGPGIEACMRCAAQHHGAFVGPVVAAANFSSYRARRSRITTFVPVSSAVAKRTRLQPSSYEIIPNFIPDDLVVESLQPRPDGPIVFVGDLTKDKGAEVLLEAYRLLESPPPLILAGRRFSDTPLELPDGAHAAGLLPYDQVLELMHSASLVVVPSIVADCCPTVVLEAMAIGRPVVAAASGGIVDMVEDGVTGRLVDPGNAPALAQAIAEVLGNPELAQAMGSSGCEQVRPFTSSHVVGRIEELYERVRGAPRSGARGELRGNR